MTTDAPKRKRPRSRAADEPTQDQEVVPAPNESARQDARQDEQGDRQDTIHTEQNLQAVRQTKQGVRQDQQGNRQDQQGIEQAVQKGRIDTLDTKVTDIQDEQGARQDQQSTEQVTQGVRQETQASAQVVQGLKLDAQSHQIEQMAEGVELLATTVITLNERVYTKNSLDKQRNILIIAATIFFLLTSTVLGLLLYRIDSATDQTAAFAQQRFDEATSSRRQLADCELPPGRVLGDGFVNEGKCFQESAQRTKAFIEDAVARIEDSVRKLLIEQEEAKAANRTLTSDVRRAAAASAAALRRLTPSNTAPPTTTTTGTTVPQTPPSSPPMPPPPSPRGDGDHLGGLVCDVLGILGLCG